MNLPQNRQRAHDSEDRARSWSVAGCNGAAAAGCAKRRAGARLAACRSLQRCHILHADFLLSFAHRSPLVSHSARRRGLGAFAPRPASRTNPVRIPLLPCLGVLPIPLASNLLQSKTKETTRKEKSDGQT